MEIFTYFSIQPIRSIVLLFFWTCYNNLKSSDLNYLETVKSFDSLFLDCMSVSISINDTPSLNSLCIKTIKPASLLTLIIFIFGVSSLRHKKKKSTAGSSHRIDSLLTVWSNEKLKNESLEKFIEYLNFKLLTKVKTHAPKTEILTDWCTPTPFLIFKRDWFLECGLE